jgi:hypothetical protein
MGNLYELNQLISTGQNYDKHRQSKLTYLATDIAELSLTSYYHNHPHFHMLPEFVCTIHTEDQPFIVKCRRQQRPH